MHKTTLEQSIAGGQIIKLSKETGANKPELSHKTCQVEYNFARLVSHLSMQYYQYAINKEHRTLKNGVRMSENLQPVNQEITDLYITLKRYHFKNKSTLYANRYLFCSADTIQKIL